MNSVLITVRGPDREADLAAPAQTPLALLLPSLLEAAAGPEPVDPGGWELCPPGRPPLAADRSLAEHGVVDGGVLQLRRASGGGAVEHVATRPLPGAQELLPLDRTRVVLPDRPTAVERLRSALRPRPLDAPSAAGGSGPRGEASYRWELDRIITEPKLGDPLTIAVVSAAEGAGATTIATLLGSLIAALRGDRVIAAEGGSIEALARGQAGDDDRGRDVSLRRSIDGLLELDPPGDPTSSEAGREDCAGAIASLRGLSQVLVLDCGALGGPSTVAALEAADQVVVVCDGERPGSEGPAVPASSSLGGKPWFAVVNRQLRIGARVDLGRFQRRLPGSRGLVAVNRDRVLAGRLRSGRFTWVQKEPAGAWPRSVRELAALLASDWSAR